MKNFIIKFLIFSSPVYLGVLTLIYLDIFRVFRDYDQYYENSCVSLNRSVLCTRTHYNKRAKEKYNSFILGSSRSQAFKCRDWKQYLEKDASPFHFDGGAEGIYGISKKMQYLDEIGDKIDNVLIIVDRYTFAITKNTPGSPFIADPSVSKESKIDFYTTFLDVSYDFLYAYIDYSISGQYKPYMEGKLERPGTFQEVDDISCDVWYGHDGDIEKDSIGFYAKFEKFLKKRKLTEDRSALNNTSCKIEGIALEQTKIIKTILDKNKAKYKIVISPIFEQIPMEEKALKTLQDIFGAKNVYNFSGKNQYSQPISNFYETSHYRPNVAREIMKTIYTQ